MQTRCRKRDLLSCFWINLIVDLWFIADIVVNCRTGYMLEGHFYDDDWLALKKYLQTGFIVDFCGSFPLNIILIAVDPNNPYGREYSDGADSSQDYTRLNRMLRILRMTKLFKLARMVSHARRSDTCNMHAHMRNVLSCACSCLMFLCMFMWQHGHVLHALVCIPCARPH